MGLAVEERKGRWRLSDELEPTLRAMGKRGDIIATLDRAVRTRELVASPADYAIYNPAHFDEQPIVGRIAARGLADEQVALGTFVQHQLTLVARQPPFDTEAGQLGLQRYRAFVDMVGRRLARPDQSPIVAAIAGEAATDG